MNCPLFRALCLVGAMLLSACSTAPRPIEMQIAEDGQVLSGYMNVGPNVQDVQLQNADDGMTCKGISLLGYAVPGCESTGSFRLECSDGRTVAGDWKMEDCAGGAGSGRDSEGNEARFLLGDRTRGAVVVDSVAEVDASPGIEVSPSRVANYGFRFGGQYAAGFGIDGDVLFEDTQSGLVIVEVAGEAVPMALSENSVASGQEAFVLFPEIDTARVASVLLLDNGSGLMRVENAAINSSGLPVFDVDGHVLGLTVVHDEGMRLLDARRLRRYLRMVAPTIADKPAASSSAHALRERIVKAR